MSLSWQYLQRFAITFAAILAAGVFGFSLTDWGARLPLTILPSGIAVAVLVRWGRSLWPAVFLAAGGIDVYTAIGLHHHNVWIVALGVGTGLAAASALTAWFLERNGFDRHFSRSKDVVLFIVAPALGMPLASSFGLLGFALNYPDMHISAIDWLRWWGNTTAGVWLLGPILIAVSRQSLARFMENRISAAAWLAGVVASCAILLLAPVEYGRPVALMLSALLTVIAPIRFGLVVAAAGAVLISGSAAVGFLFGIGVFGQYGILQGLIAVWCLCAALIGFSLIITALLAQRDAAADEKLRAELRYEQIFDGSPQPLLVHDAASGALLLANAAAERQYGWDRATPLATTIDALAAPGFRAVPLPMDAEPFETRHRTQSGRELDVEVWRRTIEFAGKAAELVFAIDVTERRALGRALLDAVAGEQRRIGQEMHDGLGQELTGLALSARALATRAQRERQLIAGDLDQLAMLANHCIAGVRRIVQGLSPLSDGDGSLEAALAALAALAQHSALGGPAVRFRTRGDAPLGADATVCAHLYRIAQEAVQNALKHAGATQIEIELWVGSETLRLSIQDDGRGPPQHEAPRASGLGMRTMRFRAQAIGGRLLIGHRPGGGTSVVCETPNAPPGAMAASA